MEGKVLGRTGGVTKVCEQSAGVDSLKQGGWNYVSTLVCLEPPRFWRRYLTGEYRKSRAG